MEIRGSVCYLHIPYMDGWTCSLCGEAVTSLSGAKDHIVKRHPSIELRYMCRQCNKHILTYRWAQCHFPRCPGPEGNLTQDENKFICEACEAGFSSSRALSTHERHAHPELRNLKRLQKPVTVETHGNTVWLPEVEMLRLNDELKNSKFINKEISKILTSKSGKQISDKRRRLGLCNKLLPEPDLTMEDELDNETGVDGNKETEMDALEKVPTDMGIDNFGAP